MDKTTNNTNQFEKYETIAVLILPNIKNNIINTFDKYIDGQKAGLYIYQNYIKKANPNASNHVTLESIIATCTYIALSKENIDQAIRTYRENRRVYKRNWSYTIKKEIESLDNMNPKNPQLLKEYANSLSLINELDRSDTRKLTIKELMMEKYESVENWRFDTTAPITDFCFLGQKPVTSVANGFVNDVTLESLNIIENIYGVL